MPDLLDWLVENEPNFSKSRLPSLYSDLAQQKAANPGGFAKNALDWQTALIRATLAGRLQSDRKITLQSSDQLLDTLSSQRYGRPSGLGLVLDEGIRNGKFIGLQGFLSSEQSIFQKSWIPSPYTVLRWSLRQVGLFRNDSYDTDGRLRAGTLVLIDALEHVSKEVTDSQEEKGSGLADRVMSRQAFVNLVAETNVGKLSASEMEVLLRFLQRDKGVLSYDSQTVKFRSTSAEHPEPITQEDATIASIKSLVTSLELQISTLNDRIAQLQVTAKNAVQAKNKTSALSALRSKKLAETNLQSRIETLHKLEEVYNKIEQAVDQAQMIQVMEASATTLKSLNKRVGGVERVDAIMDDLREQMGQVEEVGQVIQEPLTGSAIVDESEIDEELEALEEQEAKVKEEQEAEATKRRLAELERQHDNVQITAGIAQTSHPDGKTNSLAEPRDDSDAELLSTSQKLASIHLNDTSREDRERQQRKDGEQPIAA